jgi:SAM domain (Sterile alpha motif)
MMRATPGSRLAVMDIVVWLRSLGLGKYEAAFRENEIDETVLPNLTAEDLKDLGRRHRWAPPQAAGCNRCSP